MNEKLMNEEELKRMEAKDNLAMERMIAEGGAVSEGVTSYPRNVDGGKLPDRRPDTKRTH